MSSNAFAMSRPRVRYQRAPKARSCDHPRFIQLVNELARINEAKSKQEHDQGTGDANQADPSPTALTLVPTTTPTPITTTTTTTTTTSTHSSNVIAANDSSVCGAENPVVVAEYSSRGGSTVYPSTNNHSTTSGSCCSVPQTSDRFRSLDDHNRLLYHQHLHQQQRLQYFRQELPPQCSSDNLHQDDRCLCKTTTTHFGYTKQNLVQQNNNTSDFSNTNSDLRQDENRSKRKRSSNDTSNTRRSSSCNGGKKHKSSSDTMRPLSPSFTKCPICLLDSMDRDPSFTNTCFHLFCYVCIENWAKNKATCPLCRTKFTKIIYSIKSATSYEEKVASPIRRDDDDAYIADRLMLEHLTVINPNSNAARNTNNDDVQFLFENLRNPEVLMPQYYVNQIDPRQGEPIHSFNTVTTSANFNPNVPHPPYPNPNFSPMASNYIALFPPNRIAPPTSTAITSAYTANTSLTNIDPGSRRISRSERYIYSRNYEAPSVEGSSHVPRASNTNINQPVVPLERHHHQQHQHQNHHQHHRSTLDMSARQNQRIEQSHTHLQFSYPNPARHYNPNPYTRRSYTNPQVEAQQYILNTLYRPMPDM